MKKEKTKTQTKSNSTKTHQLSRGKSRPCIKCDYKYGCCKKCDLCLKCHQQDYGTPKEIAVRDYSLETKRLIKEIVRINPGDLEAFDLADFLAIRPF